LKCLGPHNGPRQLVNAFAFSSEGHNAEIRSEAAVAAGAKAAAAARAEATIAPRSDCSVILLGRELGEGGAPRRVQILFDALRSVDRNHSDPPAPTK